MQTSGFMKKIINTPQFVSVVFRDSYCVSSGAFCKEHQGTEDV